MRFLSERPNDPNWQGFLTPKDALVALDYLNEHSGEARPALIGKCTGYFEMKPRGLCFQFAEGGKTHPLGAWFDAMEGAAPNLDRLCGIFLRDIGNSPSPPKQKFLGILSCISDFDNFTESSDEYIEYDSTRPAHFPLLKYLLSNYIALRKLDIFAVQDVAVATAILAATEGRLLSLTCSTASYDGIAVHCAGLEELNVSQLPASNRALWSTVGSSLLWIGADCELREGLQAAAQMKTLCPKLESVHLVNHEEVDFCADLLTSYGNQLRVAEIGHFSEASVQALVNACPKAKFYHTNRGSEFSTMKVLGKQLISCSIYLYSRPNFNELAAAADSCPNLEAFSLWVYEEDDSMFRYSMAALVRSPKRHLASLDIFTTLSTSPADTLHVLADQTGSLRSLSLCGHLYGAAEKFIFWPIAEANPLLGKVTVRLPCYKIDARLGRTYEETIRRTEDQVLDIIETFVEQCKSMTQLSIESQIRKFRLGLLFMAKVKRLFLEQKRETKRRIPHVEIFGIPLF